MKQNSLLSGSFKESLPSWVNHFRPFVVPSIERPRHARHYFQLNLESNQVSFNRREAVKSAVRWTAEVRSAFPSARAAFKCEYRNARFVYNLMTATGTMRSLVGSAA